MFLLGILVLSGVIACYLAVATNSVNRMRLILVGAVSGIVIDTILALYGFNYQNVRSAFFAVLALPCIALAWKVFDRELVTPYPKLATVGAVAAALLSVLPFLYTSVYLPETADVAIQPALTAGTPVSMSPSRGLLDLKFALQNKSSIKAVVLTSMVAVYGITYRGKNAGFASSPSPKALVEAGLNKSYTSNLEFKGKSYSTLVSLRRVIGDGSWLYSNTTYTDEISVMIPAGKYQELLVVLALRYARADRLKLTDQYFGPKIVSRKGCTDIRAAWFFTQSRLSQLTRGRETAITDWCVTPSVPHSTAYFSGAPGRVTSSQVTRLEALAYALKSAERIWVIRLPAKPDHRRDHSMHTNDRVDP